MGTIVDTSKISTHLFVVNSIYKMRLMAVLLAVWSVWLLSILENSNGTEFTDCMTKCWFNGTSCDDNCTAFYADCNKHNCSLTAGVDQADCTLGCLAVIQVCAEGCPNHPGR